MIEHEVQYHGKPLHTCGGIGLSYLVFSHPI
jgi:hypothetical protein